MQVCGCPLVTNVFSLTGEFCRASKKHCVKHYCWEKLRRAEIDMERVRQVKRIFLEEFLVTVVMGNDYIFLSFLTLD